MATYQLDDLKTGLLKLSDDEISYVLDELNNDLNKFAEDSFYSVTKQASAFTLYSTNKKRTPIYRIDIAYATCEDDFTPAQVKEGLYYIQVQSGENTYANVRYCKGLSPQEIVEGISLSLQGGVGYTVAP